MNHNTPLTGSALTNGPSIGHVDGAEKLAVFLLRLGGFGKFTQSLIKLGDGCFRVLGVF